MPARKYFEEDVRKWVEYYNKVYSMDEVAKYFNKSKAVVNRNLKKYKNILGFKHKDEIQEDLYKQNKRLCLPLTGCGKIRSLDDFYFRKDSGKYKEQCRDCRSKYDKQWNAKNIEYRQKYNKEYGKQNRKKISTQEKKRKQHDIKFRLIKNVRTRMNNALNGSIKTATAKEYLGCTSDELKKYIESKFESGMNWDNYGLYGWHIDHIKPLSAFDLTSKEQLLKAGHYTNLQPLWAEDNISKGANN